MNRAACSWLADPNIIEPRLVDSGAAEVAAQVVHFFVEEIQLAREGLYFGFGADVDVKIEFAAQTVFGVLAILAHHDDGGLNRGEHREEQVQQDERIVIPASLPQYDVDRCVDDQHEQETK